MSDKKQATPNLETADEVKPAQSSKSWEQVAAKNSEPETLDSSAFEEQPASTALETPTHEELLTKINELEANQAKLVRLAAEKENLINRLKTETEKDKKFAIAKFAQELLGVVDSLELSLQALPADNDALKTFREGIEMTLKMLLTTLEKFGVKTVHPLNEKFDPAFHEAISMQENKEVADGTVLTVLQKGYLLNERLIRPAMVIVAKTVTTTTETAK